MRKNEKLTSFNAPEESIGYLLWHISLAWRNSLEAILKPLQLTHPQFVVLTTIYWLTRKGEPVSQIDISKAAGLDPNTTSQIVRTLEKKNFIKRVHSLNEKNKNPYVTESGYQVLAKALPAVEKADSHFFELLNNEESTTLLALFQKLTRKPSFNSEKSSPLLESDTKE